MFFQEKILKSFYRHTETMNRKMKFLILFFALLVLLPLFPTACGKPDKKTQFIGPTDLEDIPFEENVESRIRKKAGQGGEKTEADAIIDLIIKGKGAAGSGNNRVDMHFYIGGISWNKTTIWQALGNAFINCQNKFARHISQKGFLSHLKNLDWRFSHSLFSAGEGRIGALERNGKIVPEPLRPFKIKRTPVTVLNKHFAFYGDVFIYTLTPAVENSVLYANHTISPQKDRTIQYDAPEYIHNTHKGGLDNPLPGLDDILTNKYEVIRDGSRVEVFVVTDYFPTYSEEEIDSFIGKHKSVRFHLLSSHSQSGFLGSLRDMVEKSGGAAKQLCSNKNIGPELAEIVLQN